MDNDRLKSRLEALDISQTDLARAIGITPDKVNKVFAGRRQWKAIEVKSIEAVLTEAENGDGYGKLPDLMPTEAAQEYVPVEILPTYAGMGGGGSGDGDRETALVPRALVQEMLRGKPSDFLVINVRGDSMEPDFHHGDQLLVDTRDTSPAQPGYFALWDGEWGEYVVKNVERSRAGEVRIFSSNPKYERESVAAETTRIIGRPVWFGRRL